VVKSILHIYSIRIVGDHETIDQREAGFPRLVTLVSMKWIGNPWRGNGKYLSSKPTL